MKIALIVGHSSGSQGAYGNAGIGEWAFNDELLHSMSFEGKFTKKHEYYIMYRSSDIKGYKAQMVDLHNRIDNIGCELSVSFHFNSFHNPSANGNEVLYCSIAGKHYADIMDECLDSLPNRDRGVKIVTTGSRGGWFCCLGKSKAIIVEPFFGANQRDFIRDGKHRRILEVAYSEFFKRI